jgi:hypothetical protein
VAIFDLTFFRACLCLESDVRVVSIRSHRQWRKLCRCTDDAVRRYPCDPPIMCRLQCFIFSPNWLFSAQRRAVTQHSPRFGTHTSGPIRPGFCRPTVNLLLYFYAYFLLASLAEANRRLRKKVCSQNKKSSNFYIFTSRDRFFSKTALKIGENLGIFFCFTVYFRKVFFFG